MKLLSDYHTHSKYSRFGHGKDTIEDMVYRANEMGLEELAITDHGLKHLFGTNKEKLKRARAIIDDINTWSKTKILLGIEADILNTNGDLDIDDDVLDLIDVLCAGYHPAIKTDFAGFLGGQKKNQTAIDRATSAYINAIKKYPINFITHIDSILKTDLYKIGCACYENDVAIEINDRHVNWSKEQVDALLKSKCMFIVNSDAHSCNEIGKADFAFKIIKKYNIPAFSLVNVEFDEKEMSDEDKEMDLFYGIFKERQKANNKKIEELNRKKETQFTNTLSKEMEDALKEIAMEKGIAYQSKNDEDKVVSDEQIVDDVAYYMEELAKRKGTYTFKKNRMKDEEEGNESEEKKEADFEEDVGSSDFFSSVYGNNMEKFARELEKDYPQKDTQNNFDDKYKKRVINNVASQDNIYQDENNYNQDFYHSDEYVPSTEPAEEIESFEDKKNDASDDFVGVNNLKSNDYKPEMKNNFAESQSFYSGKKKTDDAVQQGKDSGDDTSLKKQNNSYKPNKNLLNQINFQDIKEEHIENNYGDFSEESLKKISASSQKDSSYAKDNTSQETQFKKLNTHKDDNNSSNPLISDFFDDGIDSSEFNVNEKNLNHSNGAFLKNNSVEINQNTSLQKHNASSGINKGTFIGLNNNISNQINKEKDKQEMVKPKKKSGLGNGLVDFSSLKGEDDD